MLLLVAMQMEQSITGTYYGVFGKSLGDFCKYVMNEKNK